ncbi:hypothetical protein ACE1CD_21630 [Aerosakkonema sp. BLCC-F183]|uniref:hypothetical protein n=1 Tax=Aerosakkonema sp. BLCC-F183 TaxID=3342834 RepID=UPI0035B7CDC9
MKPELPPIYFFHIPKTAGISLRSIIRSAYPPEDCLPVYEIQDLLTLNREQINRYRCFMGHFGTGLFSLLERDVCCVTMLRDPFEHIVSNFYFCQQMLPKYQKYLPSEWNQIIADITSSDELGKSINTDFFRKLLANPQTLYLSTDIDLIPFLKQPTSLLSVESFYIQELTEIEMKERVDKAKKRLDQMAVVGVVEQFAESVSLVCDFIGIDSPSIIAHENIGPKRQAIGKKSYRESGLIPPDVVEQIDELTVGEREVYNYAKTLLAKKLAERQRKNATCASSSSLVSRVVNKVRSRMNW